MKTSIRLLVLNLILSLPLYSSDKIDTTKLDAYIRKGVSDYSVAGVAIGIVSDTAVLFQKGYGVLRETNSEAVTPESLFPIGSCTKAFTCACLGMLVDVHTVAWDDKVVKYLPDFATADPCVASQLTIRDVLSHRTGLGNGNGDLLLFGTHYARNELVEKIRTLQMKDGFRERYGYNNLMYLVAGQIIEKVSNERWEEFIEKRLFKTIGMGHTTTDLGISLQTDHLAFPHNEQGALSSYWNIFDTSVGPSGSIVSTIADMNAWMQLLLNKGKRNGQQVLAGNTVKEMFSPQTTMQVNSFWKHNGVNFEAYGLGWKLNDYGGSLVAEHTGGGAGFICDMFLIPEKKIGVVILTNQMTWLASALQYYIVDRILGKTERDWSAEMLGYYKEEMKKAKQDKESLLQKRSIGTHPSVALARYRGVYRDKVYGTAAITMKSDSLQFRFTPAEGFYDCTLEHWEHDTFKAEFPLSKELDFPMGFLTFEINAQGVVEGFKIKSLNDPLFDDCYFKREADN